MTSSPPGPAGVFDRAADDYDAVGVPWFGPIAAALVSRLDVQPGERVLDLGCGRGAALRLLADAVGPRGSVLGLDLAPRMVALTADELADRSHVEVRVGDAADPAVPPSSFDVVCGALVLFFLPDPVAALHRWRAALVDGGRVGVSSFGPAPDWVDADEVVGPFLPEEHRRPRTPAAGPFTSDAGVENLLRQAGFSDVVTGHEDVTARFRDVDHYLAWTWSHGMRGMWEALPADAHEAVRTAFRERLEPRLAERGELAFTQQVRLTTARH